MEGHGHILSAFFLLIVLPFVYSSSSTCNAGNNCLSLLPFAANSSQVTADCFSFLSSHAPTTFLASETTLVTQTITLSRGFPTHARPVASLDSFANNLLAVVPSPYARACSNKNDYYNACLCVGASVETKTVFDITTITTYTTTWAYYTPESSNSTVPGLDSVTVGSNQDSEATSLAISAGPSLPAGAFFSLTSTEAQTAATTTPSSIMFWTTIMTGSGNFSSTAMTGSSNVSSATTIGSSSISNTFRGQRPPLTVTSPTQVSLPAQWKNVPSPSSLATGSTFFTILCSSSSTTSTSTVSKAVTTAASCAGVATPTITGGYAPSIPTSYDNCSINPSSPNILIELLGEGGTQALGDVNGGAELVNNTETLLFSFVQMRGAPCGIFDLSTRAANGTELYLGMYGSGQVRLVTQSSNGQSPSAFIDSYLTSVWSMDPSGNISAGILGGFRLSLMVEPSTKQVKVIPS